jgi:hypothetical protein
VYRCISIFITIQWETLLEATLLWRTFQILKNRKKINNSGWIWYLMREEGCFNIHGKQLPTGKILLTFIHWKTISTTIQWNTGLMGFTYPIPERWRMCTISYSIPRWQTAISCGRCRSSNMIWYAEMHRQTVEKLT